MVWLNLAGHCSGSHSRSIHRSSPTFHLVKDVIGFKYSCSSAAQTAEGLNPRGSSVTFLLGHAGCRRLFNDHLYIIKTQKRSGAGVKQASRWIKAEPHLPCLSSFINSRKLNTYWPKLLPLSPSHVTLECFPWYKHRFWGCYGFNTVDQFGCVLHKLNVSVPQRYPAG